MTDIVERLRSLNADFLHEEAADEIERLRADLAGLENTMRAVARGRREGIEAALAAADAEPEPEGEMPAKLANTDRRILVLAAVRATKREIDGRIRALLTESAQ